MEEEFRKTVRFFLLCMALLAAALLVCYFVSAHSRGGCDQWGEVLRHAGERRLRGGY